MTNTVFKFYCTYPRFLCGHLNMCVHLRAGLYLKVERTLRLPWWLSRKESACNVGDEDSIPGLGRCPGEGNGNLLQPGKAHGQRDLVGYGPWGS